jgi:glycosyltransferase involved in cell wall biosynthesis
MKQEIPARLSIGLPVYNGENFLEECLESILGQTFRDFELIISDNASTDRTESICLRFADRDPRVKYYRNERNIGAAPNFNRVFELSDSKYFKWIAHDDLHEPGFVEQCIRILERDPSVVLAYTRAITIDWQGTRTRLRNWGTHPELGSKKPVIRFRASLLPPKDPIPLPIFAVMRSAALRKTPLQAGFAACDLALLSELSLHGRFHEVFEALFLQREHGKRAGHKLSRDPHTASDFWMGKQGKNLELPSWRHVSALRHAVAQSPLEFWQRLHCYQEILVWMKRQRSDLLNDLILAGGRMPVVGPIVQINYKRYMGRKWQSDIRRLSKEIQSLVPEGSTLIVVDEGNFGADVFPQRHPVPFIEREGQYWGPPASDDAAIQAIELTRERGAGFIVVAWPAFWWLDYYQGWSEYLRSRYRCIKQNNRFVVFDLRQLNRSRPERQESPK